MTGCVAVFDVGKTNIKLVVFDGDGKVVADRSHPNASLAPDADWPYLRLDTDRAWRFLLSALKEVGAEHPIEAISITTHGASGVLVSDTGVALPPVDYEFDGFAAVDAAYDAVRPPFDECFSTSSVRGLNLGRQIFYLEQTFPEQFAAARAFLACPQFWSWRLSGVMATEVTSLGAHTDLWRPKEGRLSSLVESQGWTRLFPPIRRAWETLGPPQARKLPRRPDFRRTCASSAARTIRTLRWFPISLRAATRSPCCRPAPGSSSWRSAARPPIVEKADMLANVDVTRPARADGAPDARARVRRAGGGTRPPRRSKSDVAALVAAGVMAVPAFTDQGGPFAGRKGFIEGQAPTTPAARAALATLYCALMSAHMLKLLEAPGDLIVEGGFNRSPAFAGVLAALMPDRDVLMAPASGAAEGAALLARWDETHAPPMLRRADPWGVPGLLAYRERWEAAL